MEFYKEIKILGLTASQTLDLGASSYNHKGIIVVGPTQINIKGYSKGSLDVLGITFGIPGILGFDLKSIIPIRIGQITPDADGTIFLLN